MLSSVGKLADKTFVLGFLLPSLLATLSFAHWIGCPAGIQGFCQSLEAANPFESLTYLVLAVFAFAVLLVALNNVIYRTYEGYNPPLSWARRKMARSQRRRFDRLKKSYGKLQRRDDDLAASKIKYQILRRFPSSESLALMKASLLPTAFGNVIRAFEVYPLEVYGAESIALWPRLLTTIPKDFLDQISDARSLVDFALNSSLLALALSVLSVLRVIEILLWHNGPLSAWTGLSDRLYPYNLWQTMSITGVFAVVSVATYRLAVERAISWGETVKSSFDCYLNDLAVKLGYDLPTSPAERKAVWNSISRVVMYKHEPPAFAAKTTEASVPVSPNSSVTVEIETL